MAAERPMAPNWIAFGDIRGHFEPCGCDPRSDLGGIRRISAQVQREKSKDLSLLVFNLGNSFQVGDAAVINQKNIYISQALDLLKPTASLLNYFEFSQWEHLTPTNSYVLSNLKRNSLSKKIKSLPTIADVVLNGEVSVFGFVEPSVSQLDSKNYLDGFDRSQFKKLIDLRKASSKYKILLYSGSSVLLKRIVAAKLFDEIIAANDAAPGAELGDEEKQNEEKLVFARIDGQEILKTPFGGQGLLRSPSIQSRPPVLPLSEVNLTEPAKKITSPADCKPTLFGRDCNPMAVLNAPRQRVYWLTKANEEGESAEILDLVKKYREESSGNMSRLVKEREPFLKDSPFIGSESCETCHRQAYDQWKKSKHKTAFETLENARRDQDPDCVSCHVVGFSDKGGFVSKQTSPQFAGVQCENCHGPRKDHVAHPQPISNTGKSKTPHDPNLTGCLTCHVPNHSPAFAKDKMKYWESIKH
jgi:hypothetical protein